MNLRFLLSLFALATATAAPGLAHAQHAPYGKPITLEQARKVLAAAEAEARKVVAPAGVSLAVVDSGCHVVALVRMDNTSLGSLPIAQDKAATACNFRLDTKGAQDSLAQGGGSLGMLALRGLTPVQGGVQIVVGGEIVGAVGSSGGTSPQDEQIARAGAAALAK